MRHFSPAQPRHSIPNPLTGPPRRHSVSLEVT
jgi:hypothetical protein